MSAYDNRILEEYYSILQNQGKETADMIYDIYENAGRFNGPTSLDRARDVVRNPRLKSAGTKALGYLDTAADPIQKLFMNTADSIPLGRGGGLATRMAGGAVGKAIARGLPILGAVTAVGDVGDIITNDTSLGNKAMDTAAMGVGGTIGGVLGMGNPLAIAAGASTGKFLSDGTQWWFGDKKTPEQRKMELALAQLQGGGMV